MNFFVTGGSRGIGEAIVLHAARAGHDVAFTYREHEALASEVCRKAEAIRPGGRFRAYRLDVCDPAAVDTVGDRVVDDYETVHVVVSNAAINRNDLVVSMADEDWDAVLRTNLTGAFYVCRQFLRTFLANRFGRVVLISSLAARGVSGQAAYSASKAGLLGLSTTIAKEYGHKGITSNVVSPGFFDTDLSRSDMSEANRQFWMRYCPQGRLGELPEVAEVVVFLASPGAAFINGQEIRINGGLEWAP